MKKQIFNVVDESINNKMFFGSAEAMNQHYGYNFLTTNAAFIKKKLKHKPLKRGVACTNTQS